MATSRCVQREDFGPAPSTPTIGAVAPRAPYLDWGPRRNDIAQRGCGVFDDATRDTLLDVHGS